MRIFYVFMFFFWKLLFDRIPDTHECMRKRGMNDVVRSKKREYEQFS